MHMNELDERSGWVYDWGKRIELGKKAITSRDRKSLSATFGAKAWRQEWDMSQSTRW